MTTEITRSTSPRLPRPADYTPYSNRILANAGPRVSTRNLWLLALAVVLSIVGLIALALMLPTR
jgi:hypothetical protein